MDSTTMILVALAVWAVVWIAASAVWALHGVTRRGC